MILRITGYGDPLLRKKSVKINPGYPDLDKLVSDMYETMYAANGVGLAAPQVGLNIRLIVIDNTEAVEDGTGMKIVLVNPEVIKVGGNEVSIEEGCLSVPTIRDDVVRNDQVTVKYCDEKFVEHTKTFTGLNARVVLHEYDHLEGILFVDRLSYLKKKLLKTKLNNIITGNVDISYPMKFYGKRKK